jgi:hypothetical protein
VDFQSTQAKQKQNKKIPPKFDKILGCYNSYTDIGRWGGIKLFHHPRNCYLVIKIPRKKLTE